MPFNGPGHLPYYHTFMQHAYLYRMGKHVLDYCFYLEGDNPSGHIICFNYALRILGGYGGNGCQRMGPKAEDGLYIGLNPRAPA